MYAQVGIIEVWLIDLAENQVEVYRQPGSGGYQNVEQLKPEQTLSPSALPDFVVTVADVVG